MDASGSLFTCISCAVAFSEPALQRAHFASDWHRYNMKVGVVSMAIPLVARTDSHWLPFFPPAAPSGDPPARLGDRVQPKSY